MERESIVSMQVGKDVVEKIVKAKIEAAVIAALSQESTMIEKAVGLCLNAGVNSNGDYTRSSYDVAGTMLEVLAKNAIKDATREALKQWCTNNKEKIQKQIEQHFNTKNKQLAAHFFEGMANSLESEYRLTVNFDSKK